MLYVVVLTWTTLQSRTGFSLCSFSLWEKLHRENPVFITGMGLQCNRLNLIGPGSYVWAKKPVSTQKQKNYTIPIFLTYAFPDVRRQFYVHKGPSINYVRGHTITTWTKWAGRGWFYPVFGWGVGQKIAKLCPLSCWMPSKHM